MAAVGEVEIRPGLVVYVDTEQLRAIGGSETNAELTGTEDRAVHGPHQFLVLSVDRIQEGSCLAVPLFSARANGSLTLDRPKMGGSLSVWRNGTYHFSRWQHWRIPLGAFAATSSGELSDPADRCTYAEADSAELASIAAWQHKNRTPFRALT